MDKEVFLTRLHAKHDKRLIDAAFDFALAAHAGDFRMNGDPYFAHCVAVAQHLLNLQVDSATVAAALLHDVIEEEKADFQTLEKEFGQTVAKLVDGVSVVKSFTTRTGEKEYYENMRKLLLAAAKDVRVVLIRLAEKLHNLETIQNLTDPQKRFELSKVFDLYAPLADRLGVQYLKRSLEDLAFQYVYPNEHQIIEDYLAMRMDDAENLLVVLETKIRELLLQRGILAEVNHRVKSYYSIYKKFLRKGAGDTLSVFLTKLYDKYGMMILVDTVEDCYRVLSLLHRAWSQPSDGLDDYIVKPKPNGYRALHTVLDVSKTDKVEVQVKTKAMHEYNEYGPAAHFYYKEAGNSVITPKDEVGNQVTWLKQLGEWHEEISGDSEFEEAFKIDAFGDRIFVLTPKGDVKNLPIGSTPIDFAFEVHTDIGYKMVGAKVNGKTVPLSYQLKTGDICEIMINKNKKLPSQDWINIAYRPYTKRLIKKILQREVA